MPLVCLPRNPGGISGEDLPPVLCGGACDAAHVHVAGVKQEGAGVPHVELEAGYVPQGGFHVVGGV